MLTKNSAGSKKNGKTTQRRGSSSSRRGSKNSKASGTAVASGVATPTDEPQKTLEPTAIEGKLSLSSSNVGYSAAIRSSVRRSSATAKSGPHMAPLIGQRIDSLIKEIDPNYGIEPDAEEQVLQLADDFLEKVTNQAVRLAQHRGSKTVDVRDLQIVLAKNFGIVVPGLGMPPARSINRTSTTSKVSSSLTTVAPTKRACSSEAGLRKKANTQE